MATVIVALHDEQELPELAQRFSEAFVLGVEPSGPARPALALRGTRAPRDASLIQVPPERLPEPEHRLANLEEGPDLPEHEVTCEALEDLRFVIQLLVPR